MFTRRHLLYAGAAAGALVVARLARPHAASAASRVYEVTHSDEEWHKLLTPAQFNVLRQEGTERPFTSALLNEHRAGTFSCTHRRPNSKAAPAGQASGRRWRTLSMRPRIVRSA
jgi:peptide-methionine (R)-S-oxide reductase